MKRCGKEEMGKGKRKEEVRDGRWGEEEAVGEEVGDRARVCVCMHCGRCQSWGKGHSSSCPRASALLLPLHSPNVALPANGFVSSLGGLALCGTRTLYLLFGCLPSPPARSRLYIAGSLLTWASRCGCALTFRVCMCR